MASQAATIPQGKKKVSRRELERQLLEKQLEVMEQDRQWKAKEYGEKEKEKGEKEKAEKRGKWIGAAKKPFKILAAPFGWLSVIKGNPFGTVVIFNIIYLFLSVWPLQILPYSLFWEGWISLFALLWMAGWTGSFILTLLGFIVLFGLPFLKDIQVMGAVKLSETDAYKFMRNPFEYVYANVYSSYAGFKNPVVAEEEPVRGIEFLRFETADVFKEGEQIVIPGRASIDGLDSVGGGKVKVVFSCYDIEKGGEKKLTKGVVNVADRSVDFTEVEPGTKKMVDFECAFKDGLKFKERSVEKRFIGEQYTEEEGVEVGGRIVTKKMVGVFATYADFEQVGALRIYGVMEENGAADLIEAGIKDPQLGSDGYMNSVCRKGCGGPIVLRLSTGVQPITQNKVPTLNVELRKKSGVGKLVGIKSVEFDVDEALDRKKLVFKEEDPGCDFSGRYVEEGSLQEANERLKQEDKSGESGGSGGSVDRTGFNCKYVLEEPGEVLNFGEVTARAVYDFEVMRLGYVEIYKMKEEEEKDVT